MTKTKKAGRPKLEGSNEWARWLADNDIDERLVASATGIGMATLARYRRGQRVPRNAQLARLLAFVAKKSDVCKSCGQLPISSRSFG